MKTYLHTTFSPSMLAISPTGEVRLSFSTIAPQQARDLVCDQETLSCIAYASTASAVDDALLMPRGLTPVGKVSVRLRDLGDRLLIARYRGPTIPDGSEGLPPGGSFVWMLVEVIR